jgi:bifunctional NMN adenylyltransferase/nudix hydrolase
MFKKLKRFVIEKLGGSADRIYPTSFQAVDVVVIRRKDNTMLLGQKWTDKNRTAAKQEIRFIGGFVDPADDCLETAARRELGEEGGRNLEVSRPKYVGSFRVDDPRYRNSVDKIMSAVYVTEYLWGFEEAGDDIAAVDWYDIEWVKTHYQDKGVFAPEHIPLVKMLIGKGVI